MTGRQESMVWCLGCAVLNAALVDSLFSKFLALGFFAAALWYRVKPEDEG